MGTEARGWLGVIDYSVDVISLSLVDPWLFSDWIWSFFLLCLRKTY